MSEYDKYDFEKEFIMTYSKLFFQMPVELPLELMPVIRSYRVNAEGEFLNHIFNEVYGVLLCMTLIDL